MIIYNASKDEVKLLTYIATDALYLVCLAHNCSMQKFVDQGSNPRHSSDLRCSSDKVLNLLSHQVTPFLFSLFCFVLFLMAL